MERYEATESVWKNRLKQPKPRSRRRKRTRITPCSITATSSAATRYVQRWGKDSRRRMQPKVRCGTGQRPTARPQNIEVPNRGIAAEVSVAPGSLFVSRRCKPIYPQNCKWELPTADSMLLFALLLVRQRGQKAISGSENNPASSDSDNRFTRPGQWKSQQSEEKPRPRSTVKRQPERNTDCSRLHRREGLRYQPGI